MKQLIHIIWWVLGTALPLFTAPAIEQADLTGADLVASMISSDNCTNPPCFFNQSIENISMMNVESLLEDLQGVNPIAVEKTANEIRWKWSTDTIRHLTSGRVDTFSIIDNNFIRFDLNGRASRYDLAVHLSFGEMLDTFGNDFIILPWSPHRVLGDGYAVLYPQLQGYFLIFTDCENPQITESIDVVSYTFSRLIHIEINTIEQFSIWRGYNTTLPNCSKFPSG